VQDRYPILHRTRAKCAWMNTSDLEVLIHVVRLGSFAATARELGTDPSSVSRAIAALEEELGTRLFQRNTRHLSLTEAGSAFVERMAPALQEMTQAQAAALDATGEVRGRLRITMSNAFAVRQLSPHLPALCRAYPALDLDLVLTESKIDLIAERIDLAVRIGKLRDSSLVGVPLIQFGYRVVASPAWLDAQAQRPTRPQDLQSIPCLCFALLGFRDHWQFSAAERTDVTTVAIHPRLASTNALMLREGALAGLGPSLLSDWMIGDDLASGALVDLFPNYTVVTTDAPTTAWAVYPSRSHVPAKVRAFIDFLRAALTSEHK
jgi:DNA-binding transcriptional LysR family regulator